MDSVSGDTIVKRIVYWPRGVPKKEEDINSFFAAFATRGWKKCKNGRLKRGYEKIAIYVDKLGEPQHAARQLPDGTWTSKIGDWEDISHDTLESLEGVSYGEVFRKCFMKRKIKSKVSVKKENNIMQIISNWFRLLVSRLLSG